jgi:hypothetical protein
MAVPAWPVTPSSALCRTGGGGADDGGHQECQPEDAGKERHQAERQRTETADQIRRQRSETGNDQPAHGQLDVVLPAKRCGSGTVVIRS